MLETGAATVSHLIVFDDRTNVLRHVGGSLPWPPFMNAVYTTHTSAL